jgi:hypothetical protein
MSPGPRETPTAAQVRRGRTTTHSQPHADRDAHTILHTYTLRPQASRVGDESRGQRGRSRGSRSRGETPRAPPLRLRRAVPPAAPAAGMPPAAPAGSTSTGRMLSHRLERWPRGQAREGGSEGQACEGGAAPAIWVLRREWRRLRLRRAALHRRPTAVPTRARGRREATRAATAAEARAPQESRTCSCTAGIDGCASARATPNAALLLAALPRHAERHSG